MTGVTAPESAPVRLKIDLGALADNWRELARRSAPGRCAAVVKANAYGTGVSEAAPALWAAGARIFFVAHFSEGVAARRALPAQAQIYVLNGLESEADPKDYVEHRLAPVIGGEEELAALVRLRRATRQALAIGFASRHRHEPARLRVPRSPASRDGDAWAHERGRPLDQPLRLVRNPRRSHQPGADRAVRGGPRGFSASRRLARQLVWHVPRPRARSTTWRGRATRSTAAIRRRGAQTRCMPWSR